MSWPQFNDIDISLYETWQGWLGFFVPEVHSNFSAVYDHNVDQGVVRIYSPERTSGTKIFGPGNLPSWIWTDDDSNYVEFWSGITPTFADNTVLGPGSSVSWTEFWYPVHDLGGVSNANVNGTLYLDNQGDALMLGAAVTQGEARELILWQNDIPIQTWTLTLSPGQTFTTEVA